MTVLILLDGSSKKMENQYRSALQEALAKPCQVMKNNNIWSRKNRCRCSCLWSSSFLLINKKIETDVIRDGLNQHLRPQT